MTSNCNVVWVTGVPRSGTTLVAASLSKGTNQKLKPEFTVGSRLIKIYGEIRDYSDQSRKEAFFGSDDQLRQTFYELVKGALDRSRQGFAGSLVIKDPELIKSMSLIADLFQSRPKVIVVVRHPVRVAQSLLAVRHRQGIETNLSECLRTIADYFHFAAEALDNPVLDCLLVRYECFLEDTENVSRSIYKHTGIWLGDGFDEVPDFIAPSDPFFSPLYGMPIIRDENLLKTDTCSIEEISWFRKNATMAMHALGY